MKIKVGQFKNQLHGAVSECCVTFNNAKDRMLYR